MLNIEQIKKLCSLHERGYIIFLKSQINDNCDYLITDIRVGTQEDQEQLENLHGMESETILAEMVFVHEVLGSEFFFKCYETNVSEIKVHPPAIQDWE